MYKKSRLKEELRLTETGKYFFEMAEHLNKMVELPKHTNSLPINADDRIKPYKKVDAILIPRGATNGDVIESMFNPVHIFKYTSDVQVYFSEKYYKFFEMSWWNAPYKREVKE